MNIMWDSWIMFQYESDYYRHWGILSDLVVMNGGWLIWLGDGITKEMVNVVWVEYDHRCSYVHSKYMNYVVEPDSEPLFFQVSKNFIVELVEPIRFEAVFQGFQVAKTSWGSSSSARYLPCRLPADRGLPWRGRHPSQQRGRSLHGALCTHGQGHQKKWDGVVGWSW